MGTPESDFSLLMFPWVAHGHISPYLELSKALLTRKKTLTIYFCTTSINFDPINNFINKNTLHGSIRLVELELEPSPDLPPQYHGTKNLPHSLKLTLIKAFQASNLSFSKIITTIKPNLVIYDIFQPWASKIAASEGIPAVHFSIFGAAFLALLHHQHTFKDAPFPFPEMQFQEYELRNLNSIIDYLFANIYEVDQDFIFGNFKQSRDVVLVKTSKGFEGKYIDYLSTMSERKIVPVGPLINHTAMNDEDESSTIIKWLSKKRKNSTLFVSFGSEYFLSEDEIAEIAKGLELCNDNINFIWIIRFPSGADRSIDEVLPRGFLERMRERGERGLVVSGWAPQASILAHENTGGFMSHCGWSSIMESMHFGVPVVAMAVKVDQPINARMLAAAGACVEVARQDGSVFEGEEIARAVEKVMAEEGGGGGMRRRAKDLGERMKMEEGEALDEVAEQLWQLCRFEKQT